MLIVWPTTREVGVSAAEMRLLLIYNHYRLVNKAVRDRNIAKMVMNGM